MIVMGFSTPIILADSDGDPTFKIIIGVLFFVIWIVTQVVSSFNSRRQKTRLPPAPQQRADPPTGRPKPMGRIDQRLEKKRQAADLRREAAEARQRAAAELQKMGRRQPPPMPVPVKRTPVEQPPMRQQPAARQQPQRQPARQPQTKRPTPIATTAAPARRMNIAASAIGGDEVKKPEGPTNNQRLRAVLRPRNLRKEFILTELLQKPVGMRDPL